MLFACVLMLCLIESFKWKWKCIWFSYQASDKAVLCGRNVRNPQVRATSDKFENCTLIFLILSLSLPLCVTSISSKVSGKSLQTYQPDTPQIWQGDSSYLRCKCKQKSLWKPQSQSWVVEWAWKIVDYGLASTDLYTRHYWIKFQALASSNCCYHQLIIFSQNLNSSENPLWAVFHCHFLCSILIVQIYTHNGIFPIGWIRFMQRSVYCILVYLVLSLNYIIWVKLLQKMHLKILPIA